MFDHSVVLAMCASTVSSKMLAEIAGNFFPYRDQIFEKKKRKKEGKEREKEGEKKGKEKEGKRKKNVENFVDTTKRISHDQTYFLNLHIIMLTYLSLIKGMCHFCHQETIPCSLLDDLPIGRSVFVRFHVIFMTRTHRFAIRREQEDPSVPP